MNMNQKIWNAIEITKYSKIPMLLLSNPGFGKTTAIQQYANTYDYYLETLIGSRMSSEEICGFMVNEVGKEALLHKNPCWYSNILEASNNGRKTILFIDEISTCPEIVQGPLLSLIFDRTIGNNKYLPEDTIIISAANYSSNLPEYMNIMTPTLNRFCILNLSEGIGNTSLLKSFIFGDTEPIKNAYLDIDVDIKKDYYNFMKDCFLNNPYLNFQNTDMKSLYADSDGYIYNILSPRTVSYLERILNQTIKLQIEDDEFMLQIVNGCIGAGTSSSQSDGEQFREYLKNKFCDFYKNILDKILRKEITENKSYNFTGDIFEDYKTIKIDLEKKTISSEAIEKIQTEFTYFDDIITEKKKFNKTESEKNLLLCFDLLKKIIDIDSSILLFKFFNDVFSLANLTSVEYAEELASSLNNTSLKGCKSISILKAIEPSKKANIREGGFIYIMNKTGSQNISILRSDVQPSEYMSESFVALSKADYVKFERPTISSDGIFEWKKIA